MLVVLTQYKFISMLCLNIYVYLRVNKKKKKKFSLYTLFDSEIVIGETFIKFNKFTIYFIHLYRVLYNLLSITFKY